MSTFLVPGPPHLRLVTDADIRPALLDEWDHWMQAQSFSLATRTERRRILLAIARDTNCSLTDITAEQIVNYLRRFAGPSTKETYYSAIRAWSRWLVLTARRPDDPTVFVPRPRVPRRQPRPCHTKHLELVLKSGIQEQTRAKILLIMYSGLRASEVARAHGGQFDLVATQLTITGKGGVTSVLPLHPVLGELAKAMPPGLWFPSPVNQSRSIRSDSVSNAISDAFTRLGIAGTAHMIRHWFASEMISRGVDIRVVQELMRHASLATTALYTAVPDAMRRQAVERLPTYLVEPQHITKTRMV